MSDHAAPTLTPTRTPRDVFMELLDECIHARGDLGEDKKYAEWLKTLKAEWVADYDGAHDALAARLGEQAALVEAAVAYGKAVEAETVAERAWVEATRDTAGTIRQAWLAAIEAERVASLDVLKEARAYAARQAEPGAPADGSGEGQGGG